MISSNWKNVLIIAPCYPKPTWIKNCKVGPNKDVEIQNINLYILRTNLYIRWLLKSPIRELGPHNLWLTSSVYLLFTRSTSSSTNDYSSGAVRFRVLLFKFIRKYFEVKSKWNISVWCSANVLPLMDFITHTYFITLLSFSFSEAASRTYIRYRLEFKLLLLNLVLVVSKSYRKRFGLRWLFASVC